MIHVLPHLPLELDPPRAAGLLADWGFLAEPDLPDRAGPARLLVAIRDQPTLRHFDPESVDFWATSDGRGVRRRLTRASPMPIESEFSWGPIRILDRLAIGNEYLAFGGRLSAASIDDATIIVLESPAPLLRRGGHSQPWDHGAQSLGAFFGRLKVAVDYVPGFEARAADADPVDRYAAFVADLVARYGASAQLRLAHPELWTLLSAEERRLRAEHPAEWAAGLELLEACRLT